MALPLDKLGTTDPPRSVGLPGIVAHGRRTMARCSRSFPTVVDDDSTGNGVVVTKVATARQAEVV
ncbi:MAG TPA: hypothetical protein VKD21_09585 [Acidimicrobiales bacterium]|nr:hypothetical protein [Acidimicrobiales bacterium]